MFKYFVYLLVLHNNSFNVAGLWDKNLECPMACTCRLQHLTETAIFRFMQKNKDNEPRSESDVHLNNDVLYEDEDLNPQYAEDNPLLRSITCILQTDVDPLDLLEKLPKDIDSLTLIQGYDSGNKSIRFSDLEAFKNLIIIEMQGTRMINEKNASTFFCEIDTPLPEIKYLNLDTVLIKYSKKPLTNFEKENHEEGVTFEYTKQMNPNSRPLTLVQKGEKQEVIPYKKYVDDHKKQEAPLFIGFVSLILLRITNCEVNNVNWEMFDGLQNLEHLILEKNNLKYIPDFAFYGTPNLKFLSLAYNNLLNLQVTDLAGLLELEYLDMSHNNFSQLSELSLPPFPKLKLANFANNPITVVFPNTFEVMNTTDSLILGGNDTAISIIANSFIGLKLLKKLTINNLIVPKLKRELLVGMPNVNELIMSGNISEIEYDAFLDMYHLQKLILNSCNINNVSMDAFMGLDNLQILDLSKNKLQFLPPGIFDELTRLKELYLNNNLFRQLPIDIFSKTHAKLIRLNENLWHCSCRMSEWKPMVVNRIKQKAFKTCNYKNDKGVGCGGSNNYIIKYVFDNRIAPKCATPKKFLNWSVFHVMRKQLRCANYKPKLKKSKSNSTETSDTLQFSNKQNKIPKALPSSQRNSAKNPVNNQTQKIKKPVKQYLLTNLNVAEDQPTKISLFSPEISTNNNEDNDLNNVHPFDSNLGNSDEFVMTKSQKPKKQELQSKIRKLKKLRKGGFKQNDQQTQIPHEKPSQK